MPLKDGSLSPGICEKDVFGLEFLRRENRNPNIAKLQAIVQKAGSRNRAWQYNLRCRM